MQLTAEKVEAGWRLLPLQTPKGTPVMVPNKPLAEALMAEWLPIKKAPKTGDIPLTQYVCTVLDMTAPDPAKVLADIAQYLPTDLLVLRHAEPVELVELETQYWQPWLDWAAGLGVGLEPHTSLHPIPMPPASLDAFKARLEKMDAFRLTAVEVAAGLFGSALLALAVGEGALTPAKALTAALVEEDFQISRWGLTDEQEKRRHNVTAEAKVLALYLKLLD